MNYRLPTLNPVFGAADRGALISYTYAFDVMMRQPASYIDRILRGETPSNLPVQAPTKYVLSINLKVAKRWVSVSRQRCLSWQIA